MIGPHQIAVSQYALGLEHLIHLLAQVKVFAFQTILVVAILVIRIVLFVIYQLALVSLLQIQEFVQDMVNVFSKIIVHVKMVGIHLKTALNSIATQN